MLQMTTAKLTSDLKMDSVKKFTDKLKQFDLINKETIETIEHIRALKLNLIDEVNRRTELKNIN